MTTSTARPARSRTARIAFFAVPVLAGGLALAFSLRPGSGTTSSTDALYTVRKGDLRISVIETGTLKATKSVDIVSELEGQSVLLHLVPEGTHVQEGELLAELDASNLEERTTQQHISYEKARASWVEAKENFEIQKNQCESDIKVVELKVVFAETDLKKFIEGDEPTEMNDATSAIMLADEELKRAKDKRDWSEKLSTKGYVTRTELEADDLQVKKRAVDLESSRQKKDLLEKYEHPKQRKKLTSDLEEAKKELERAQRKARAELARAEANLNAQKATLDLEESRLKKLEGQLAKAKIYAPAAGMVVYASTSRGRFDRDERPVEEGATVRERQLLVSLPDMTSMTALTKIHESSLSKVRRGLPAFVTIDAMKDGRVEGRVAKVAMLPDSQSTWLNPDL
jgi:HlyD family secretion protein